ncbi:hypothetical protein F2Q70_00031674 [Brassica cretica]|uniref:Uncharacterized protein n=1 Tax=Brassica cretica TaxID=69181 RepID=A0A8S9FGS4_BRACR|nr:hypothetical protein F2Q70_00031674 [Brassica cretica]KAF3597155.1 hypothetical protein DY000_02024962 [Brassica cretica]
MNLKFWNINGEETIEPPARDKSKGRKKNPAKRMKSVHESPTKGAMDRCSSLKIDVS